MKILLNTKRYIIILFSAIIIVAGIVIIGSSPVSRDSRPVRVVIAKGSTAREVSRILKDDGVIRSSLIFIMTCKINALSAKIKPGVYELSPAMNVKQIIKKMVSGDTLEAWLTVPEGYTARQIGDLLQAKKLVNSDEFIRIAILKGYDFPGQSFVTGDNLEGYLFPDTYLIPRDSDPESIINKMLKTFNDKVIEKNQEEIKHAVISHFGAKGASFDDGLQKILIVASLVEREAKTEKDRPMIAAVLYNRLKKHMKLEVDATVSYRPGESSKNKAKIYYSDLNSDSPYNTYKYFGLPPTPICNPGLASIKAAIHPAATDALYYVAKKDGSHVFSKTFQEHIKAKNAIKNGVI